MPKTTKTQAVLAPKASRSLAPPVQETMAEQLAIESVATFAAAIRKRSNDHEDAALEVVSGGAELLGTREGT